MKLRTAVLAALVVALPVVSGSVLAAETKSSGFSDLLRGFIGSGDDKTPQAEAPQTKSTTTPESAPLPRASTAGVDDGRRVPFSRGEIQLSFAPLVRETAPSVVNVYAEKMTRRQESPFAGDPFFEQFFGGAFRQAPPRVQSSLGSGVVVDSKGLIVTNYHVIDGADQIRIALSDGREFGATILLADQEIDLAVLKIDAGAALPALSIGDSDSIAVGDLVLAIGNPFGVGQTTTSGIISATARSHIGVSDFGFFIQTDAAINPGNSGGALIDMTGRLIGINAAIFSRSGGSNGIGFAIPSNMVRAVVAQAESGATQFERPYIGAQFEEITPDIAEALGMARPFGAIVTDVTDGGPAAKSGLKAGDVVLAVNGSEIEHPDALGYRLLVHNVGEKVTLSVRRKQDNVDVTVELTKAPAEGSAGGRLTIEGRGPFAGAIVQGVRDRSGRSVAIVGFKSGSPAERAGFQKGDKVLAINGEAVETPDDMQRLAGEDTRWWRFTIDRNGAVINQMLRF